MAQAQRTPVTGTFGATGASNGFVTAKGFNISVSGTYAGTIQIQRSFDQGVTWLNVLELTANQEVERRVDDPEVGVYWRLECTAYTSGTATYRISG